MSLRCPEHGLAELGFFQEGVGRGLSFGHLDSFSLVFGRLVSPRMVVPAHPPT